MKLFLSCIILLCVITCLPSTFLAQSNGDDRNETVQKAIAALEQKWAEAQKIGDAKAVAPLLTEDFVNTDTDGKFSGKSKLLSNLKGGKWEHNEISDVKVTVHGSAAIATGAWSGKGVDGDGTKIDRHERWTDTWVKTAGGKWECAASQQTSTK